MISVIIPTFNRETQLASAIESVLNQNYPNFECIIVDDASQDNSVEMITRFFGDKCTILCNKHNLGVSASRNIGVAHSRGEWIAFLDSDDIWHKDKLSKQVDYIQKNPDCQILQTREIWIRHGKRVNPPKTHQKLEGYIFNESLQRCMITPSSVIMRRSLFKDRGGFNESLPACEDYDLWLKITAHWPVGLVDEYLLTRYGGHNDQLSSTVPILDRFRIRSLIDLLAGNNGLSDNQIETVRKTLAFKARVVANGLKKRDRIAEYERYREIAERYG